jgi:hypothetical protein
MLFSKRKDIVLPQNQPSGTGAQTLTFTVKQERRRLEAITFSLQVAEASTTTHNTWAGPAGVVKAIRIIANDGPAGGGQRNIVEVTGPALLSYIRQVGLNIDRATQDGYATSIPAGTGARTFTLSYYVPIRNPLLQEPFGNVLALPLSSTYLASDVQVQVDLYDIGASGIIFGTAAGAYGSNAAILQTHLVETPDSFPYIRSELRTDTGVSFNSTGNVPYEFVSGGFLTGFLAQGFTTLSSGALQRTSTRPTTLLSSGGVYRVEYGREILIRTNDNLMVNLNDLSTPEVYPSASQSISSGTNYLQARMMPGEVFFDFLTDLPGQDAFSLASCPDLNTDALGGDKFRWVLNDAAAVTSTNMIHVTYHKLLSSRSSILEVVNGFSKQGLSA